MDKNGADKRKYVRMLDEVNNGDVHLVGGKNASLGEMIQGLSNADIHVPNGFATTIDAYNDFLKKNDLIEGIRSLIDLYKEGALDLDQAGDAIRKHFLSCSFPENVSMEIRQAYRHLCAMYEVDDLDVAVRSSATAEDLPETSFAGMLESYLNIKGEEELLRACRNCFASLFTDRAIQYREQMGLDHMGISLCVVVQKMVRSDKAGAGVMFSVDKDTGFPDMVVITAAWGLGESVVQGEVIPDEYRVYKLLLDHANNMPIVEKVVGNKRKKSVYSEDGGIKYERTTPEERISYVLDDSDILTLARWASAIEAHYGRPMDMEWAKDEDSGMLFIVQARPLATAFRRDAALRFWTLKGKRTILLTGTSIGEGIAEGKTVLIENFQDVDKLSESAIAVSESANTAWVSELKRKNIRAIVTDFGGRNSHTALICRELGIPGVVGTRNATRTLKPGRQVTVQAIEGDHGYVYDGAVACSGEVVHLDDIPYTAMKVMINIAGAAAAFQWWRLPCSGVGLVRMDYILAQRIRIHPVALLEFKSLSNTRVKYQIDALTESYEDKSEYFIDKLSASLGKIAASRYPDPVIVRATNLNSEEFRGLLGGELFEKRLNGQKKELRGVHRFLHPDYKAAFALECEALRRVRQEMGFNNIHFMIPHNEELSEAEVIIARIEESGLRRGEGGFCIYLCCDFPSNVAYAADFANLYDGLSLDIRKLPRWLDSGQIPLKGGASRASQDSNSSMRKVLEGVNEACHAQGSTFTVRGRLLADASDLVSLFVDIGVDAISVNPEAIPNVTGWIAKAEEGKK